MKAYALILALAAPAAVLAAPVPNDEAEFFSLEKASLEETLNTPTSVATRSAMRLRETPGLVTVINAEEIQAMGARGLVDVLHMVPEFSFGTDVQGNLGLGVRGNWANEGKVLLIWDGQVYNETLYSTIQFDRFPVDQIEEIEIIRGPGSVMYGGFAELAVINIKTKTWRTLKGGEAYAAYGQGSRARLRDYAGLSYNDKLGDTEVSAKAFWGEGQRSDGRYTDVNGYSYNMNGNSAIRPKSVNLSASGKDASIRLIVDDYSMRERDHYDAAMSTGDSRLAFPSAFAEARYSLCLPGMLRLEPKLNYARAMAWQQKTPSDIAYDKETERFTAGLTAFYKPLSAAEFTAGGEYYHDAVNVHSITAPAGQYSDGADSVIYDNYALFGQGNFAMDLVNLNAGLRYDKHSQYGSSLVPRLAATRVAGDFNFKAIYSRAFRAPSIENIRLNPGIKPEKSATGELEGGYKASETLYLSANIFHTRIKDPIVYIASGSSETYKNYPRTGTKGLGLNMKFKEGGLRADFGYFHYFTDCNRVDIYSVPGRGSYMLGFPKHKLTASASVPLGPGLSVNPTAIYNSKRYGYSRGALKVFGERAVFGLNFLMKDRPAKGLALSLGVSDMFNAGYSYVQPYDGGHEALPAPSREVFAKAVYAF